MTKMYVATQTIVSGVIAWISARLGLLYPVLCVLGCMMVVDYLTGMLASKKEAIEYPDNFALGGALCVKKR